MKKIALLFLLIVVCCLTVSAATYCRQCQFKNDQIVCGDTLSGAAWGCTTLMGLCQEWGTCYHGGCQLNPGDIAAALAENPWIGSKELAADVLRFSPTLH